MATDNGISHDVEIGRGLAIALAALAAIKLCNAIELSLIITATFKRSGGLYFWSFNTATAGIAVYVVGFIFEFFTHLHLPALSITLVVIDWWGMVTGQSVVLYSRLYLVLSGPEEATLSTGHDHHKRHDRAFPNDNPDLRRQLLKCRPFPWPHSFYEKVQVTVFFLQETIVSSLYIHSTYKILKPVEHIKDDELRQVMRHLILMNVIVIAFDITLLATEYSGHYEIRVKYKGAPYSTKLEIEFRILNHLMCLTRERVQQTVARTAEARSGHHIAVIQTTSRASGGVLPI